MKIYKMMKVVKLTQNYILMNINLKKLKNEDSCIVGEDKLSVIKI